MTKVTTMKRKKVRGLDRDILKALGLDADVMAMMGMDVGKKVREILKKLGKDVDDGVGFLDGMENDLDLMALFDRHKLEALCNRSKGAYVLHTLYESFIEENDLDDGHPDFHSILTENARDPLPKSSLKDDASKTSPRGNRHQYGVIYCVRVGIGNRPMYRYDELVDWFNIHYAPSLLLKAA